MAHPARPRRRPAVCPFLQFGMLDAMRRDPLIYQVRITLVMFDIGRDCFAALARGTILATRAHGKYFQWKLLTRANVSGGRESRKIFLETRWPLSRGRGSPPILVSPPKNTTQKFFPFSKTFRGQCGGKGLDYNLAETHNCKYN